MNVQVQPHIRAMKSLGVWSVVVRVHAYMNMHVCVCMHVCRQQWGLCHMNMYMYVCIYGCMYVCVCMYVCIYVSMYVHMYICK